MKGNINNAGAVGMISRIVRELNNANDLAAFSPRNMAS